MQSNAEYTGRNLDRLCRVCGGEFVTTLPLGEYAEFFKLRVDTAMDPFLLHTRSRSIAPRSRSFLARVLRRLDRAWSGKNGKLRQFRTFMQCCDSCHAVTPSCEWTYQDLLGLYRDYRSENYNCDRISVESSYAHIAAHIGSHPEEIRNRNAAVDRFIGACSVDIGGASAIDYGGGDGRFLPSIVLEKYSTIDVFDASDAPIHRSLDGKRVRRIATPATEFYELLMCMHVLEHVGNPRAFMIDALRHVKPGGLLYIEVPLELTEESRRVFRTRVVDVPFTIHEHINSYDRTTVSTMIRSMDGLDLIAEEDGIVELGWTSAAIGRYLARKRG